MEACDLVKLDEPFSPIDIEWRIGRCGEGQHGVWAVALAYIDARAVRSRLDQTCGKTGWKIEQPVPVHSGGQLVGFMVGISIWDGQKWNTKWDGADVTETEAFKGGLSSAVRRAAAAHGIGAYLYGLGEEYCEISMERKPDWRYAKTKDGKVFYWLPPRLPAWALPKGSGEAPAAQRPEPPAKAPEGRSDAPAASGGESKPRGQKPACPECGSIEWVLEDRENPNHFFCWKNKAKNKLGCGHKWSMQESAQEIAAEMGLKVASDLLPKSTATLAHEEIGKAVKAKSIERLDKLKDRIIERVKDGTITFEESDALEQALTEGRKMITSAKTHDEWTAQKQQQARERDAGQGGMEELGERF